MSFDPNSPKSLAQAEAISAGLEVLTSVDRARISMACGTGKTLVQIRVAEGLVEAARSRSSGAQRIVVHVPTLALVRQNLDEWKAHNTWGGNFNWIAVCSDEAVNGRSKAAKSRRARYVPGDDDVFFDAGELAELGQPVNATEESEHHRIKQFLEAAASNPDAVSVIFTTYQSAPVVGDALKELEQETGVSQGFDVGVFDEAHKTAGSDPQRKFAYSLRDENLLIKKRVFYTATERVLNFDEDVKEGEARSVIAMDDESLYGPRAYNLSFREAAELGIVAPYEVVVSVINDNEFDGQLDGQGAVDAEGSVYDARSIATMTAVRRAMEEMGLRKGIGFHSRIKLAKDFAEMRPAIEQARMDETTGFEQLHIDGSMSGEARRAVMQSYADPGKRSFINNAKCLTEGVNVTETDLVAFIDPKRSKTDIVQAIGRAIRLHDGKTAGRVLLPLHVSISEGETLQEALDRSAGDFKQIRDVLEALADSDDVMKEKIRLLSSRGTREGQGELPNDANLLSGIVSVRISGFTVGQFLGIDGESLASAIETRILEAVEDDWLRRLEDWKSFKATHGREPSARGEYPSERSLGTWAITQRKVFKQGKMSAERIELLQEAGFFLGSMQDFEWKNFFDRWTSFRATHGREPFQHARDSYEKSLASWTSRQRQVFKQGKMSAERIELLQEGGFVLEIIDRDDQWQENFEGWKSFKATQGKEPSTESKDPYEKSLGLWAGHQRTAFKQGKMSAERIQLLQEAGFVLESLIDVQWQEAFEGWKSFKATHGREPSRAAKDPYEKSLSSWAGNQRRALKKGAMSKERIQLFQEAGFVLESLTDVKWQENFEGWKSFKAVRGEEPSTTAKDPYEKSLSSWAGNQRTAFKKGAMSKERIQLLQEVEFVWDQRLVQWQEAFEGWKSFIATHGRVPLTTAKDLYERSVGLWVRTQRIAFKKDDLPIDRIALLYAAGFTLPGFSDADKACVDAYLASNPLPPSDDQVSQAAPVAGIETARPKIDSAPIKEKKKMPSAKELSNAVGYFQDLDDRKQGMPVVERNGNFRDPAVQSKFRQIVLSAYGGTCPITGDGENLEAAHLNRPGTDYSTAGGNEYGILLAGHLHDWYDRGAITIDLEQDPATGKCFGVLSFDQDALNRNPSLAHYSHVKRIPIVKLLDPRTWPNQASAQDMDLAMRQKARRTEIATRTQDMLEAVQAAVKVAPREERRLRQVGG